jgi:hypothetical protein
MQCAWKRNNHESQALVQWGKALITLANILNRSRAYWHVDSAAKKFEEALKIKVSHDALWCPGNAYTSQAAYACDTEKRELCEKAKVSML